MEDDPLKAFLVDKNVIKSGTYGSVVLYIDIDIISIVDKTEMLTTLKNLFSEWDSDLIEEEEEKGSGEEGEEEDEGGEENIPLPIPKKQLKKVLKRFNGVIPKDIKNKLSKQLGEDVVEKILNSDEFKKIIGGPNKKKKEGKE